jgi:hypothetical protein
MCNQLYLATDWPVLEVPAPRDVPPQRDIPGFYVVRRHRDDAETRGVRQILTGACLYYIGSWQGCGCGFSYRTIDPNAPFRQPRGPWLKEGPRPAPPPPTEQELREHAARQAMFVEMSRKGKADIEALAAYLWRVVERGPVQLLHCWSGREGEIPEQMIQGTPDVFGGSRFHFGITGLHYVISQDGQATPGLPRLAGPRTVRGAWIRQASRAAPE